MSKRPRLTDTDEKEILRLYLSGVKAYDIVDMTGRSLTSVYKILKGVLHKRTRKNIINPPCDLNVTPPSE
jgi:hypothetical protein